MGESPQQVVCVEEIVKDFRPGFGLKTKRVLHGISFSVQQGEIFGFVGPNGAGKTTTLKILMGLIFATGGKASILGHDIGESEFRRHIGYLPEGPYFYDFLTGREFLSFYAKLCGVPRAEISQRVANLLEAVGLSHAGDERLRNYSKGMLQRIGIGQALVHDPQVLFLDEPMSGLDPIGRKEIRDLIWQFRDRGKTIFMTTHILSDVEMLCDSVAIIVKGRIQYQGAPKEFLKNEHHTAEIVFAGVAKDVQAKIAERFQASVRDLDDLSQFGVAENQVDDLLRALLESGARVVSVTPRRATLETIFLHAVEEGGR